MRKLRPLIPPAERLRARVVVDEQTGCHVWTGCKTNKGYGQMGMGRVGTPRAMTHRVAYELAKGPIPSGMQIDHLCRNRLCCNPDHLEAVSPAENSRRALPGKFKTYCVHGHPFDAANTRFVVWNGKQRRKCRACERRRESMSWRDPEITPMQRIAQLEAEVAALKAQLANPLSTPDEPNPPSSCDLEGEG